MWFFCLACLIFMLSSSTDYFSLLSEKFVFLQHLCLRSSPVLESDKLLWQALICAQNISAETPWKHWLQFSGLIHLFVVSGSHFIVLQFILEKLRFPRIPQFFLLWFYNALTGFSAPGTRACLSITTAFFFKVRGDQKLLAISFLCLALEPSWAQSYSFWLSWLACLILFCTPKQKIDWIRASVFWSVWILMGFFISIWSIPLNLLIGPLIGWVLFPLAILSFIPGFELIFHQCVLILQKLLEKVADNETIVHFPKFLLQMAGLVVMSHFVLQAMGLQRQGRKVQ